MREATAGDHQARRSAPFRFARPLGVPLVGVLGLLAPEPALGKPVPVDSATPAPAASAPDPASSAAPEEPSPWQQGPAKVDLGHQVSLDLTAAYAFLPKEPAAKVLETNGSFYHDNLLGLVASADHSGDWFAVLRYDDEGYVKDDEEVDAEELLSSMREGNEQANEERKQRGFKPLTLEGWSDPPRYDKSQRHLVWALIVSDPDGKSVNHNTRILGRRGFVSLNLVTDPARLGEFKPHATALLAGTRFGTGARYEDFDASTDKVAEYGLAGLVMAGAGLGAAKLAKLGLLAKFSKVALAALIAGKKFIVLGLIALAALAKKFLGKKGDEPAT
jgi:uncharacterized membrane-anchored protein